MWGLSSLSAEADVSIKDLTQDYSMWNGLDTHTHPHKHTYTDTHKQSGVASDQTWRCRLPSCAVTVLHQEQQLSKEGLFEERGVLWAVLMEIYYTHIKDRLMYLKSFMFIRSFQFTSNYGL